MSRSASVARIAADVVACTRCPRLVEWREAAAAEPPARYRGQRYWAKPLPGFGDAQVRVLVVGLAPAAHGGNRTGRVFTGDRSGDWLFRALHRAGLASQATSSARGDGLRLRDCYVTAAVRCAPPRNAPLPSERDSCRSYLVRELAALSNVKVIVALGAFAHDATLRALGELGHPLPRPRPRFAHLAEVRIGPYALLGSFHPSQQNTFTGKLTERAFAAVFNRALALR